MYRMSIIAVVIVLLAGCNASVEVTATSDPGPELRQFDIVDTDGSNSEFDPLASLSISPFINNGEFELFWDVYSRIDYTLDVYIHSSATIPNSPPIFSQHCSPGDDCDDYPYLYCQYQTDFDVVCENASGDIQGENIGFLINRIPQTLYFILDICDYGGYCEYQAIPVSME